MLLTLCRLLALIFLIQCIFYPLHTFGFSHSIIIDVMPIGVAIVNISLSITNYTQIPCIGEALYIIDYYPNESIYVELENNTITIINLESQETNASISYLTYLAKPEENTWSLNFETRYPVTIILPENAIPIHIEPEPVTIDRINNRIVIELEPGNITITYLFIAEFKTTQTTPLPQPYIPTTFIILMSIGGLITAIAAFTIAKFLRRPRMKKKLVELDEREKLIIKILKERGEVLATDLLRLTGIPKASFYRRIRRLIALGYIEQVKKKGRTIYRLKREVTS